MQTPSSGRRVRVGQALYTASYAMIVICTCVLDLSGYSGARHAETVRMLMLCFASACIVVKVCLDRYGIRQFAVFVMSVLVLAVSLWRSRYDHVLYLLLVVCGAKGISFDKLLRADCGIRFLCVAFVIMSAWMGWLDDYTVVRPETETLRHSLGFIHPNSLGVCAAMALISWAHSRKGALGVGRFAVLAAGCFCLMEVCESRSSVACLILYAVLRIATDRKRRKARVKARLLHGPLRSLHLLSLAACVAWMLLSTSVPFLAEADAWTSFRFRNAKDVWDQYGASLLGQRVTLVSTRAAREMGIRFMLLDVAPLRMLIQGGLAATVLMEVLWREALSRSLREGDARMFVLLATFVFYGLCESTASNPGVCFALPYMSAVLFEGRKARALPGAARRRAAIA